MKVSNYLIPLLFFSLLISSCKNSTDDFNQGSEIEGSWHLVEYMPNVFFQDDQLTFDRGEIVWHFNTEEKVLFIEMAAGVDFNVIEKGIHTYEFGDNGCNYDDNKFIKVESNGLGVLIKDDIPKGILTISNACVDGHILKFER
ncbi:hypothetical protein GCM10027429_11310 [Marivirga atlantica]|jgi:hypothetical protein|uniref:Lipocalin-like domain-containing protein n=1 Tax=Marivirga atlantica TaxID=1548457 RepID=A0A937ADX0_9BACT|nr:hypothetical protein [Marivirga atlantica]MBL0764744.1 hypothetical protein [Marivirga atlantica]